MPRITVPVPRLRTAVGVTLILLATSWLAAPRILEAVGTALVREDPVVEEASVALIAAGGHPERILEAAALFREGRASRFLWCRERVSAAYERLLARGIELGDSADFYREALAKLGVPENRLEIVPERVDSTFREATVFAKVLRARGVRRALVITNRVHSRRQCKIFEDALSPEVEVVCTPSRHDDYDADSWWRDRGSARDVVSEYIKLVYYYWNDRD